MKYKYIHTFGTSFTAGGGFEHWKKKEVGIAYKDIIEYDKNQQSIHEFSWPGMLQQCVNQQVINHAKCGHGNDTLIRRTMDLVESNNFNKNENLLLFEIADLGRKEFYSTEWEKFGVLNYQLNEECTDFKAMQMAFDYHRQSKEEEDWCIENEQYFLKYLHRTLNLKKETQAIVRQLEQFYAWCDYKELNWYIVQDASYHILHPNLRGWLHKLVCNNELDTYFRICGETITGETKGYIDDGHNGIAANQFIGSNISKWLRYKEEIETIKNPQFKSKEDIKDIIQRNITNHSIEDKRVI